MRFKLPVFILTLAASSLSYGQYASAPAWQQVSPAYNTNFSPGFYPNGSPQTFPQPVQMAPAPQCCVPPVAQCQQPSNCNDSASLRMQTRRPFPCGPAWLPAPLRALVPQGYLGADFKPACYGHDACYTWPGWSRSACDRRYLSQMLRSCDNSLWPGGCRMQAHLFYGSVRLFGSSAYRQSRPWPGY